MERECYRCGTKMEEGAAFCPSCAAPQIRVSAPSAADIPGTPSLEPGTPASIEPPAIPVQAAPRPGILWKSFLRISLPVSLISASIAPVLGTLGLLLPIAGVAAVIGLYQRRHGQPVGSALGARLGAMVGLFTFGFLLVFALLNFVADPGEIQRSFEQARQQFATNPNPLAQQMLQFMATRQGMIIITVVSSFLFLILLLLTTAAAGAFVGAMSRPKDRG